VSGDLSTLPGTTVYRVSRKPLHWRIGVAGSRIKTGFILKMEVLRDESPKQEKVKRGYRAWYVPFESLKELRSLIFGSLAESSLPKHEVEVRPCEF